MTALRAPILAHRGESLAHIQLGLYEPPVDPLAEPTVPLDLTGCTAVLTVWTYQGSSTKVLELSSGGGTLTIQAASGTIIPVAIAATLDALARGTYWYTLLVTFADGEPDLTHYSTFELTD